MLRWTPAFTYGPEGEETTITFTFPITRWVVGGRTTGVQRRTGSGLVGRSVVIAVRRLAFALRFSESYWPTVCDWLAWAQTGASFLWLPGDLEEFNAWNGSVAVRLDAPRIGDGLTPQRDPQYPDLMMLPITLVREDGLAWDDPVS